MVIHAKHFAYYPLSIVPHHGFSELVSHMVHCPICDYDYTRPTATALIPGKDNYKAAPFTRGDVVTVSFEGECGHHWDICIAFHKGQTMLFSRTIEGTVRPVASP